MKEGKLQAALEAHMNEERRETQSGLHYYSTFRDCPRAFYLKYILGLQPKQTGSALIFGAAIHEALAASFADLADTSSTLSVFEQVMYSRKDEYESLDQFNADVLRGPLLLSAWLATWKDYDQEHYEVLGVEQLFQVPFGPDPEHQMIFTVRMDRIYKDKQTGNVYVIESKTTGWGIDKMFKSTAGGDQITAQIWALRKLRPEWNCHAAIVDVLYNRSSVVRCERPGAVFRSAEALQIFEMGMYATIVEITRKYKALLHNTPWPLTFMPHKNFCRLFGCPYENLCDSNVQPETVPPGFKQDPWVSALALEDLKKAQDWNLSRWHLE